MSPSAEQVPIIITHKLRKVSRMDRGFTILQTPSHTSHIILVLWATEIVVKSLSVSVMQNRSTNNITNFWRSPIRPKRSVPQLGVLVEKYTNYNPAYLTKHGNWCGPGGDRAKDGSVTDACDQCCKIHDDCYDVLLHTTEVVEFNTLLSTIIGPKALRGLKFSLPSKVRKCIPYIDVYGYYVGNGSPLCSSTTSTCSGGACQCDVNFIYCLRQAQCQLGLG